MTTYSSRQVRELLAVSRAVLTRLVRAGLVTPSLGVRREWRFSFKDLVALRAARGLAEAGVPARRISASIRKLKGELPADVPPHGLRIAAVGNTLAIMDRRGAWRSADGQYLLAFEVAARDGEVVMLDRRGSPKSALQWLDQGRGFEARRDTTGAMRCYQQALAHKINHPEIFNGLALLLKRRGRCEEAEKIYREAMFACPGDALLNFNFGVFLDEQGRAEEAIEQYRAALKLAPDMADAHENLALLYESLGRQKQALRHFNACRRLRRQ